MPERMTQPEKVHKPGRVFVCSMADLFHPTVEREWFDEVYCTMMRMAPWHTYIVLTKRPENIPLDYEWEDHIWLGVTTENQVRFEERWERLGMVGANVRFVSVEPMLGPIDMSEYNVRPDWVIAGPENGPKARRCDDAWIEALAKQSPCFFDKRDGWTRREFPKLKG